MQSCHPNCCVRPNMHSASTSQPFRNDYVYIIVCTLKDRTTKYNETSWIFSSFTLISLKLTNYLAREKTNVPKKKILSLLKKASFQRLCEKNRGSKQHNLVGAQPPPNCSFARHLIGKMVIQNAHLLITKHSPDKHHSTPSQ